MPLASNHSEYQGITAIHLGQHSNAKGCVMKITVDV